MTQLSSPLRDDSAPPRGLSLGELKERLRDGGAARVEDLLAENPEIAGDDEAVLELIMTEMAVRGGRGESASMTEWDDRLGALVADADRRGAIRRVLSSEMATLSESAPDAAAPPRAALARIGQYQILEEIGRGGMGVVYKARQMRPNRVVALKMISAGDRAEPRERARLRVEAEAAARIAHPNIVQIIESGEHDGLPYLAMEYIDGGNLARMLRSTPQPIRWAGRLTETLARAVHAAHKAGIVHRDLNPTNVLMTQTGAPKIGDFGLAKFPLAGGGGVSQDGAMLGTPSYMAPEQINHGGRDVDARTDVYALGATLYEMLTGSPPFRGLTPMETLCQVAEGEIVPPSKIRRGLPPDLETICLKCLERNPAQRYPTARALADDLRRFQNRQPIQARRASRRRRALQWAQREPLSAGLLTLCLALLVALVSMAMIYGANLRDLGRELQRQAEALSGSEYMRSATQRNMAREELLSKRRWRDLELGRIHDLAQRGKVQVGLELFDRLGPPAPSGEDFAWRYLDRLLRRSAVILGGSAHQAPVERLAVARDGRSLVSGDAAGQVVFWDLAGPRPRPRQLAITAVGPIRELALDCDESGAARTIAAIGVAEEGPAALSVWDATDRRGPWTFRSSVAEVGDLMFSRGGNWLAFRGRPAADTTWRTRLYKVEAGDWAETPGPTVEPTTRLLFSPAADLLAVGRADGSVRIHDLNAGTERTLTIPAGALPRALAYSADGARLAAGCGDRGVLVWDAATGAVVAALANLDAPAESLAFLLADQALLVREGTKTVSLLDLRQTPLERTALATRGRATTAAAVAPDGRLFALGFAEDRSEIWDADDPDAGPRPLGDLAGAVALAFGPDGRSVFVNHHDALSFSLKTTPDPHPLSKLAGHARGARAAAFGPDGAILATGGDDNQIKLWNVASGAEIAAVRAHDQPVSSLAFAPRTGELASASLDGSLRVWAIARDPLRGGVAPRLSRELRPPGPRALRSVAYSADGALLAAAGDSADVLIFDRTQNGPPAVLANAHRGAIPALAFAPSEPPLLATASRDATLKIWDPLEGDRLDAKRVNGPLLALAYSPMIETAPRLLAAAGERRIVHAWDTRDREEADPARGHPGAIRSLAFSPAGLIFATGCDDGSVRLCDSVTNQIVLTLEGHLARVNAVAFAPGGSVLASCGGDGEVFLWRAGPPEAIPNAPKP